MAKIIHWKTILGDLRTDFEDVQRKIAIETKKDIPWEKIQAKIPEPTLEMWRKLLWQCRRAGGKFQPSVGWYKPYFALDGLHFYCTVPTDEREYVVKFEDQDRYEAEYYDVVDPDFEREDTAAPVHPVEVVKKVAEQMRML